MASGTNDKLMLFIGVGKLGEQAKIAWSASHSSISLSNLISTFLLILSLSERVPKHAQHTLACDRATFGPSTSTTWPENPANAYTAKSEPYALLIYFYDIIQVRWHVLRNLLLKTTPLKLDNFASNSAR